MFTVLVNMALGRLHGTALNILTGSALDILIKEALRLLPVVALDILIRCCARSAGQGGYCTAPWYSVQHPSLRWASQGGYWCPGMRCAYCAIQGGAHPNSQRSIFPPGRSLALALPVKSALV